MARVAKTQKKPAPALTIPPGVRAPAPKPVPPPALQDPIKINITEVLAQLVALRERSGEILQAKDEEIAAAETALATLRAERAELATTLGVAPPPPPPRRTAAGIPAAPPTGELPSQILALVKSNPGGISASDIAARLQQDIKAVSAAAKKLRDANMIQSVGQARGTKYIP